MYTRLAPFRPGSPHVLAGLLAAALAATVPTAASAQSDNQQVELSFTRGTVKFDDGDMEGAIKDFEEALFLDPAHLNARYFLGLAQVQSGKPAEGIKNLKTVLEMEPSRKDIHFDIGFAYYQQQQWLPAIAEFQEATRAEPQNGSAFLYLGLAYFSHGKPADAIEPLAKAQVLDPDLALQAKFYRGMAFIAIKDKDSAVIDLEDVATKDGDSDAGQEAKRLLAGLKPAPGERALSLRGSLGYQYDSNVILLSNDPELADRYAPQAFRTGGKVDTSASKGVFALALDWRALRGETHQAGLNINGYTNWHLGKADFRDFNFTTAGGGIYYALRAERLRVRIPAGFTYAMISSDFNHFGNTIDSSPQISYQFNNQLLSILRFDIRKDMFEGEDSLADYEARSALSIGPELFQYVLFSEGKYMVGAGYKFESNTAEGDNWDYTAHQGRAEFSATPIERLGCDLGFSLYRRGFANTIQGLPAGLDTDRSDTTLTLSIGARFDIIKSALNGGVSYVYSENASTIDLFSYTRHLLTLNIGFSI